MKRPAVLLAATLVCLTNAAALGLSALNRAAIDSALTLTERELRLDRPSDSVTLLRMAWVQPSPTWFGADQAARAGFDTSLPPGTDRAAEHYRRQLQRDAYVALEYDGPAWIRYRDSMLKPEPPGVSMPNAPDTHYVRRSREQMIETHSRLVAVGVDANASRLRSEFPEASRYLIARARVAVDVHTELPNAPRIVVRVLEPMPSEINVPRPFSEKLLELTRDDTRPGGAELRSAPRFVVDLKYGRFHQPWIADLRPLR